MTNEHLKKLIEDYADRAGITPATVTKNAVGNNRVYGTLKDGGSCTLTVANRIKEYIEGASHAAS